MTIPDPLNLNELAHQLTGQNDQAELSSNGLECLQDLLEMVNLQRVRATYKGESTLESQFGHFEYNKNDANDLIINRENFINSLKGLQEDLMNASGINKDRILDNDCRGKIKTLYDKNPFWGVLISPLDENIFNHSPDYRSANLRGVPYGLTPHQAQAIRILHEAYLNGTPDVGQDYIINNLKDKDGKKWHTNNDLKDIFKSSPDAWKNLIVQGEKRGTYRLNI